MLDHTKVNDYHMQVRYPPFFRIPDGPSLRPRPDPAANRLQRMNPLPTIGLSSLGFCTLALLASALSALAFYAASPHCRWPRLRRAGRLGREIGTVAAVAALWLWMADLGVGTGLVVMLCSWMAVAMLLPALAAWHRPNAQPARERR